jgi:hypothetical protein
VWDITEGEDEMFKKSESIKISKKRMLAIQADLTSKIEKHINKSIYETKTKVFLINIQ